MRITPTYLTLRFFMSKTKSIHLGDDYIMLGALECVQLFQLMLRNMNAKKCLEVGTFTGYTSLSLAQALPDDGQVVTTDIYRNQVQFETWKKAGVDHKVVSQDFHSFKKFLTNLYIIDNIFLYLKNR